MQDFIAKLLEKSTFSRCNFQIHEKIQSQYSTFDTLFLKKSGNWIIFGKMVSQFSGSTLCKIPLTANWDPGLPRKS